MGRVDSNKGVEKRQVKKTPRCLALMIHALSADATKRFPGALDRIRVRAYHAPPAAPVSRAALRGDRRAPGRSDSAADRTMSLALGAPSNVRSPPAVIAERQEMISPRRN